MLIIKYGARDNPNKINCSEVQGESIGRILYTHLRGLAIIPLGKSLLKCSSHLPAYSGEPPNVTRGHTYAYLVLLRIEVAAFHPALSELASSFSITATP